MEKISSLVGMCLVMGATLGRLKRMNISVITRASDANSPSVVQTSESLVSPLLLPPIATNYCKLFWGKIVFQPARAKLI